MKTITIKNNTQSLTPREKSILVNLLKGKTYGEIANSLCISIRTVENNMVRIKCKFDCDTINMLYARFIDVDSLIELKVA